MIISRNENTNNHNNKYYVIMQYGIGSAPRISLNGAEMMQEPSTTAKSTWSVYAYVCVYICIFIYI